MATNVITNINLNGVSMPILAQYGYGDNSMVNFTNLQPGDTVALHTGPKVLGFGLGSTAVSSRYYQNEFRFFILYILIARSAGTMLFETGPQAFVFSVDLVSGKEPLAYVSTTGGTWRISATEVDDSSSAGGKKMLLAITGGVTTLIHMKYVLYGVA